MKKDKRQKFILFGKPSFDHKEVTAVTQVIKSGWIGTGLKCKEFEEQFANYTKAKHARAVSSCTAALHLSLEALGIGKGDEVITTAMTFIATINAIEMTGAKPVLVDVDAKTFNIDPNLVEKAVTKKTKAILPVHFGGLPCDMMALRKIADKYNLYIIEDAAHATGAIYDGKPIGGLKGNIACFSFYPNKNLASAEGGMITTPSKEFARKIEVMRLHGMDNDAWKRYRSGTNLTFSIAVKKGYKYNMTDIQAAIALEQLKKINKFMNFRHLGAKIYDNALKNLPVTLQPKPNDKWNRHALHLYLVLLDRKKIKIERNKLVQNLRDKNIGATVHYVAIHQHPYFKDRLKHGPLPISEKISDNIFTLPLHPKMSRDELRYVAEETKKAIAENSR